MDHINKITFRDSTGFIRYALLILPAITLGVFVMAYCGSSPVLWGQQIAAWLLFSLFSMPLCRAAKRIPSALWGILFLIALIATLFQTGLNGVKRWLDLGMLNVNAALLVLPALLSVLPRVKHPHPLMLAAAVILALQPDPSQLAALCAAALPLLWLRKDQRFWSLASVIILSILFACCLHVPAVLEPALYSEGILTVLGEKSWLLQVMGYASLAAVPAYFAYRYVKHGYIHLLSLAVYYTASMLFTLSGEYPVPFMGFGLSPIVGYFLAFICAPDDSVGFRAMTQTARIAHMECILDKANSALLTAQDDPGSLDALQDLVKELEAYYTGPLWKQDYDDDRAGRLPQGLKRGVLSEDAVYNLLEEWNSYRHPN